MRPARRPRRVGLVARLSSFGIPPRFLGRAHGSADVWRLTPGAARVIGRSTGIGTGLRYRFLNPLDQALVAMLLRDSLWWRLVHPPRARGGNPCRSRADEPGDRHPAVHL